MKKSFDRWQQCTGFTFEGGRKISPATPLRVRFPKDP